MADPEKSRAVSSIPQRLMGLDVGDARIGVALSDPAGISATPRCTVERGRNKKSRAKAIRQIAEMISIEGVSSVVVGMPVELCGEVGEQGQKVLLFCGALESELGRRPNTAGVDISLWDERFTTREAQRVLVSSGLKNSARRAALDRISASVILSAYMESMRLKREDEDDKQK